MDAEKLARLRRQSAEARAREKRTGTRPAASFSPSIPCEHEGPVLEWCHTCNGEARHVRECDLHERCTRGSVSDKVRSCSDCPDHTELPKKEPPSMSEEPPKSLRWAYGVTTVPARMQDSSGLLRRTLASLGRGGFERPRLFVDGACEKDLPTWAGQYEATCRFPALRVHGSWVLSLYELYIREPHADRYAIFQDDLVTCRGLREYLDSCRYPERGYWNLYTVPHNQRLAPRSAAGGTVDGWYASNQLGKGALATVFDRQTVTVLLGSEHMVLRPQDRTETVQGSGWYRGQEAVDGGIVTALKKAGWTEFVHSPSLVQHTGVETTLGKGHTVGRPAESFRGEDWDVRRLISPSIYNNI